MCGSWIYARRGQRCPRSSSKRVLRLDSRTFRSSNILSPQSAWAPPHFGRHEQRQYSTAQREEVPVRRIEGAQAAEPDLAAQRALDEEIRGAQDVPLGVDEARDTGVGGAGKRHPVLNGAEHDHGEVLVRRA